MCIRDRPHADTMNYEVMSEDIIELIEDLRLPVRPHIAGHSMGGKIVMALLLKRPDIVNKAIAVSYTHLCTTVQPEIPHQGNSAHRRHYPIL